MFCECHYRPAYSGLQKQIEHTNEKQKRRGAKQWAEADQDIDDLIDCYRHVDTLFRQLQVSASIGQSIRRLTMLE
jgi:hypothetical protein